MRVEDYVTALAAVTGEAALVASGVIDIEATDIAPGAAVFGDTINEVLSGDSTDLAQVPADTVVGILVAELVPDTVSLDAFGSLERLYRHVAQNVGGSTEWGNVATSVPQENRPTVLPIRMAFELRAAVDAAVVQSGLPSGQRHVPCALALALGLTQVKGAIDMQIGLTLALEVVFGMAKVAPMSRRGFEAAATDAQPAG